MKNNNWTYQEFRAYLLMYAAHCNEFESKEEEALLASEIDEDIFHKIHTEVVVDSDDEKLDKIQFYVSQHNLSQETKDELIRDVKKVFFADGSVDINEKHLFEELKKILR